MDLICQNLCFEALRKVYEVKVFKRKNCLCLMYSKIFLYALIAYIFVFLMLSPITIDFMIVSDHLPTYDRWYMLILIYMITVPFTVIAMVITFKVNNWAMDYEDQQRDSNAETSCFKNILHFLVKLIFFPFTSILYLLTIVEIFIRLMFFSV